MQFEVNLCWKIHFDKHSSNISQKSNFCNLFEYHNKVMKWMNDIDILEINYVNIDSIFQNHHKHS